MFSKMFKPPKPKPSHYSVSLVGAEYILVTFIDTGDQDPKYAKRYGKYPKGRILSGKEEQKVKDILTSYDVQFKIVDKERSSGKKIFIQDAGNFNNIRNTTVNNSELEDAVVNFLQQVNLYKDNVTITYGRRCFIM